MQTQVAYCNHTEVKGNILGSKSSIHDRNFRKFWTYFFHLIFAGSTFFFKILKALHKFELKNPTVKVSVPMLIALRKLLLKNYFQILIFDKRQMKLLQTRRKKLQEEIHESLDEVVKEHWESRLQFLYWKDVLNIPQHSQKNVLVNAETCSRGILENLKYCLEQSENIIMLFLSAAAISLDNIYSCVVLTI